MGNLQSSQDYYNPLTGTYDYYNNGYQTDLERYYNYRRMMYSQYYPSSTAALYNFPTNYYAQQQYYQPYQSPYNSTLGYSNYVNPYQTTSPYSYGSPMYGYSSYYPSYRTYM